VAERLSLKVDLIMANLSISPSKSALTAGMHLKSSFRLSAKGVRSSSTEPIQGVATRSRNRSADAAGIAPSEALTDVLPERLDVVMDARSSRNQGMKRLTLPECVHLLAHEEVVLVVPVVDRRKTPHAAREPRSRLLSKFRRIVLSAVTTSHMSNEARAKYVDDEFRERTISQCGHDHIEFNVKIASYPERAFLAQPNPPPSEVSRWLGSGRAGLNLELVNYGSTARVLLPLSHLPYVQVFKKREPDAPYLDPPYEYHKCLTESSLARRLTNDLFQARGDSAATVQILLGYYKHLTSKMTRGSARAAADETKTEAVTVV